MTTHQEAAARCHACDLNQASATRDALKVTMAKLDGAVVVDVTLTA